MNRSDHPAADLHGIFRDVLRDAGGAVVWDRGWQHNLIVEGARRLLASFVHGAPPATTGVDGLRVGAGLAVWDTAPVPEQPSQAALVDPSPFTLPAADLDIEFLEPASDAVSATPTNKIQIFASFGPNVPSPAPVTLREFGLIGRISGSPVLLNYRRHAAIAKDPASTLERTIWLVF